MEKNTNKHASNAVFNLKDWLNFQAMFSFNAGFSKDEVLSECIIRNNKDKFPLKESEVVDIVNKKYKSSSSKS